MSTDNLHSTSGLIHELNLKTDECNQLHSILINRPFEIKHKGDVVSYDNHLMRCKSLQNDIDNSLVKTIRVRIDEGVLHVIPFSYGVYGTDLSQLFYGIIIGVENCEKAKVFEFVEFGSWSIYDE